ncbi:integrase, partial [Amaricoccus sp. HAR-UPW-R2A-40]
AEAAARMTFEQAADACLAQRRSGFNSASHEATWWAPLPLHVLPTLGGRPVASIGIGDVVAVLEPIWLDKHRTATLVRGRIEAVLNWAISNEKRPGPNPAEWNDNLRHRLPAVSKAMRESDARPAVPVNDIARWYAACTAAPWPAARALQAVALTATRSIEARGMRWAELGGDVWTVPADRMKMREIHRVPISEPLLQLIEAQRKAVYDGPYRGSPLVFPSATGRELADLAVSDVMKKLHAADVAAGGGGWLDPASNAPAVPHGLRATFRIWAQEQRVDRDVAELALAHRERNAVVRAYARDDLLGLRRPVMAAWAGLLTGTTPVSTVGPE